MSAIDKLLKAKPDHGQALIVLGEARLAVRQPQQALDAFERSLKIRSGDPSALVGNGLALVMLGLYETAIAPLSRAVAEAGGDRAILADAYRGLGIAWRRRGDLDKAIRELRKAVVEDGEDIDARAALGEALVADNAAPSVVVGGLAGAAADAGAPESFVVPPTNVQRTAIVPTAELANYVVAHSEYSAPAFRRNLISALIASNEGTAGVQDESDDANVVESPAENVEEAK